MPLVRSGHPAGCRFRNARAIYQPITVALLRFLENVDQLILQRWLHEGHFGAYGDVIC